MFIICCALQLIFEEYSLWVTRKSEYHTRGMIFLPNAPLGFRKLQKIDGAGGGISGVSW